MKKLLTILAISVLSVGGLVQAQTSSNDVRLELTTNQLDTRGFACTYDQAANNWSPPATPDDYTQVYLGYDEDGDNLPDLSIFARSNFINTVTSNGSAYPLVWIRSSSAVGSETSVSIHRPNANMVTRHEWLLSPIPSLSSSPVSIPVGYGTFGRMSQVFPHDTWVRGIQSDPQDAQLDSWALNFEVFDGTYTQQVSPTNRVVGLRYQYTYQESDESGSNESGPYIYFTRDATNQYFGPQTLSNGFDFGPNLSLISTDNNLLSQTWWNTNRGETWGVYPIGGGSWQDDGTNTISTCEPVYLNRCGDGDRANGDFVAQRAGSTTGDPIATISEQCDPGDPADPNDDVFAPGFENGYTCNDQCQAVPAASCPTLPTFNPASVSTNSLPTSVTAACPPEAAGIQVLENGSVIAGPTQFPANQTPSATLIVPAGTSTAAQYVVECLDGDGNVLSYDNSVTEPPADCTSTLNITSSAACVASAIDPDTNTPVTHVLPGQTVEIQCDYSPFSFPFPSPFVGPVAAPPNLYYPDNQPPFFTPYVGSFSSPQFALGGLLPSGPNVVNANSGVVFAQESNFNGAATEEYGCCASLAPRTAEYTDPAGNLYRYTYWTCEDISILTDRNFCGTEVNVVDPSIEKFQSTGADLNNAPTYDIINQSGSASPMPLQSNVTRIRYRIELRDVGNFEGDVTDTIPNDPAITSCQVVSSTLLSTDPVDGPSPTQSFSPGDTITWDLIDNGTVGIFQLVYYCDIVLGSSSVLLENEATLTVNESDISLLPISSNTVAAEYDPTQGVELQKYQGTGWNGVRGVNSQVNNQQDPSNPWNIGSATGVYYQLQVTNTGQMDLTNISVTDTFPFPGCSLATHSSAPQNPTFFGGGQTTSVPNFTNLINSTNLTWTINLPSNASAHIMVFCPTVPEGQVYTNQFSVEIPSIGTASSNTVALEKPDLQLDKTQQNVTQANPAGTTTDQILPFSIGDEFRFELFYENASTAVMVTGATITDLFPDHFEVSAISTALNGLVCTPVGSTTAINVSPSLLSTTGFVDCTWTLPALIPGQTGLIVITGSFVNAVNQPYFNTGQILLDGILQAPPSVVEQDPEFLAIIEKTQTNSTDQTPITSGTVTFTTGDVFTFYLDYEVQGSQASGVVIEDVFPQDFQVTAMSLTGANVSCITTGNVTITPIVGSSLPNTFSSCEWDLGTLSANTTGQIVITGSFLGNTSPGGYFNTGSIFVDGVNQGDSVVQQIPEIITGQPDLIIEKSQYSAVNSGSNDCDPANCQYTTSNITVENNHFLSYQIVVTNTGTLAATGVEIGDTFPLGFIYTQNSLTGTTNYGGSINCTVFPGTVNVPNPDPARLECSPVSIPAGGSVTIQVDGFVLTNPGNQSNQDISVYQNTATVISTNNCQAGCSSTVTATVPDVPVMTLSKEFQTNQAEPGDTVTFTLTYNNIGDAIATGLYIDDVFPPGLTYVSHTPAPPVAGGIPFDSTSGRFDLTVLYPNGLSQGFGQPITVTATVDADYTDPTLTNTATLCYNSPFTCVSDSDTINIVLTTGFDVSKTALDANGNLLSSAQVGDTVTYQIDFINQANTPLDTYQITDILPPTVTFVPGSVTATVNGVSGVSNVTPQGSPFTLEWTCTNGGSVQLPGTSCTLPAGGTGQILFDVTVN